MSVSTGDYTPVSSTDLPISSVELPRTVTGFYPIVLVIFLTDLYIYMTYIFLVTRYCCKFDYLLQWSLGDPTDDKLSCLLFTTTPIPL